VQVSFSESGQLEIFQELNERHAAYHGTPIHKRSWYPTLAGKFGRQAEIIIGRVGKTPVGALLVLYHGEKAILHAAVSDANYRHIPVMDKLLWAFFEKAINSGGVASFDFGRTRADSGKRFFKRKWGAVEKPLNYSYLLKPGSVVPRILPENPAFAPAILVWRHLPRWVHRSIGPLVRVRIPT
jgi:lipid II:glycine glycyltransferase (peptidoglycan interpeptide bridge formation enzyme)